MLKRVMLYLMPCMALNLDANILIHIDVAAMTAPTLISVLVSIIKIAFKIVWARKEKSNHDFPRGDKES